MSRPVPVRALFKRSAAARGGKSGFALIEILIAFVILAVGLGILFSGITTAMRADRRVISSRGAARVAQSLLEEAGVSHKLAAAQREGTTGGTYTWHETITPVRINGLPSGPRSIAPNQMEPTTDLAAYWVDITVQARDGTAANLAALKLTSEARR